MKLMMGVGAMIVLFCLPAGAQSFGTGNVGGAGSINSGSSLNGGSGLHGVTSHSLPKIAETRFYMSVTSGSESEYTPSVYVPFSKAVQIGSTVQVVKPKSLAEVASEYRNAPKAKAEYSLIQDADGKIVKEEE
jgi:hypothetical protein